MTKIQTKTFQVAFDEWMFKVVEHIAKKTKKDETEIFSSIQLFDAKLQFIDGVKPENFDRGL